MPSTSQQYPSSLAFLVEDGPNIQHDLLDYDLRLLHTNCSEKIYAPLPPHVMSLRDVPVFNRLASQITKPQ